MASTSANSPTATTRKGKQAKQNYIAQIQELSNQIMIIHEKHLLLQIRTQLLKQQTPLSHLKTEGACITPNGAMFKIDNQGFLPKIMEKMYNDRVEFKKLEFEAKKNYQKTKDPIYAKETSRCHNIQWAKKISLNSAYGAIGNQYFRYYNVNQATAITTSGQFIIQYIAVSYTHLTLPTILLL